MRYEAKQNKYTKVKQKKENGNKEKPKTKNKNKQNTHARMHGIQRTLTDGTLSGKRARAVSLQKQKNHKQKIKKKNIKTKSRNRTRNKSKKQKQTKHSRTTANTPRTGRKCKVDNRIINAVAEYANTDTGNSMLSRKKPLLGPKIM